MQAGKLSEEKKKTKVELELRLKLLEVLEEKMEDDGERSLCTACSPLLPCYHSADPVKQGIG